jgi:thiamine monophosphate synthase
MVERLYHVAERLLRQLLILIQGARFFVEDKRFLAEATGIKCIHTSPEQMLYALQSAILLHGKLVAQIV